MDFHSIWFKRLLNPILRKLVGWEIFSAIDDQYKVIGYGLRKSSRSIDD